jgi:uncharacterized BrkB/YihY/UPF0761 family membrane protein
MKKILFRIFSVLVALVALCFCGSGIAVLSIKFYHWSFNIKWLDKMLTEIDGLSALVFVIIGFLFFIIAFVAFILSFEKKAE